MRATKRILAVAVGVLGLALIAKGVWDGVWPISVQLVAGILLIAFAVLRWRSL